MSKKIQSLTEYITQKIEAIDYGREPKELYLPVEYCLKNGGKRMRPLMVLLACDMFGGDLEEAVYAALGLEIFHNFTLMHDDIMDAAPIRRGKPAVHKKWSENTAILSGDVMFAQAVEFMCQSPVQYLKPLMDVFNTTVIEVCEGQQYDMNFESMDWVTEADYLNMIRLKTAVLPAACLKTGAMIAGADPKDQQLIYDFGQNIGMAFQVKDDWLDVFGTEESFGKKTGGDIVANKKTWLYIKAFEMANPDQKRDLNNAFTNRIFNPDEKINIVKHIYLELKLDESALKVMEEYYKKAFGALDKISLDDAQKEEMRILAQSLFNRKI